MALYRSDFAVGRAPTPYPDRAGNVVTVALEFTVPAGLAANDVIEMGPLPAYSTVVDATLDVDDLDTNGTPTISLDVGIVSGNAGENNGARTCGNEFFAADTTARAGGIARMSKSTGFRIAKTDADRGVGIKLAAGAATLAVGSKIRLLLQIVQ